MQGLEFRAHEGAKFSARVLLRRNFEGGLQGLKKLLLQVMKTKFHGQGLGLRP